MNVRRVLPLVLLAIMSLAVAACSPTESSPLEGTSWKMQLEGDEAYSDLAAATGITISFGEDGTFTGTYTISKYAGEYVVEGDSLTMLGPCYTSMACQAAEGIDAQQQYLFALEAAETFSVDGDTLTIYTDDSEMVFERD